MAPIQPLSRVSLEMSTSLSCAQSCTIVCSSSGATRAEVSEAEATWLTRKWLLLGLLLGDNFTDLGLSVPGMCFRQV